MKEKNKKIIILTAIAILVLLTLIIGATYAYFLVGITNNFGTKTITATTPSIGSVALTQGNNLLLDLTAADMMNKNSDTIYYASSSGTTTSSTTENIGVATVTGLGTYNCSYSLKMDDSTNSLYDKFQSMDTKSIGQIVLTINGVEYDFNTADLFPKIISGTMNGLSSSNIGYITAQLKVVNKTNVDQSALSGSNLSITFTIESFNCEAIDEIAMGDYLLENPTNGLYITNTEYGLFRYVGTSADNYICFGTSDKDVCLNNTDKYMYRIVGITDTGEIRLVKNEALPNKMKLSPNAYLFDSNSSSGSIEYLLNNYNILDNYYLKNENYLPSSWLSKLVEYNMCIGSSIFGDPNYTTEESCNDSLVTKVGLLGMLDYAMVSSNYGTSWLTYNETEWIAHSSTIDGDYYGWWAMSNGYPFWDNADAEHSIRPVIQISNTTIYISGSGTITAPFIIS